VATALAHASLSPQLSAQIAKQLADLDGGPREPMNATEGLGIASTTLAGGFLRGVAGFFQEPVRGVRGLGVWKGLPVGLTRALMSLLVAPSVGLLSALAQLSLGLRNFLTSPGIGNLQQRLPRHNRSAIDSLFAYSGKRANGALLVSRRLGVQSVYLTHVYVHLDDSPGKEVYLLLVTDAWLVAAKEIDSQDKWALPLAAIESVETVGSCTLCISAAAYKNRHLVRCRNDSQAHFLLGIIDRTRRGLSCKACFEHSPLFDSFF